MESDVGKNRRVYGKGFVDGLKAARQEVSVGISAARMRELESTLTGVERKVYDNVAIQSPMTTHEVVQAMKRSTGSNPDFKIVAGRLKHLVERGLVYEPSHERWQREAPKDAASPRAERGLSVVGQGGSSVQSEQPVQAIRRIHGEILQLLDDTERHIKAIEDERDRALERSAKADRLAEVLKDFQA